MRRQAVDPKAKSYWEAYFGDYGKAWTKDIPRRVTAALASELQTELVRQGGAGAPEVKIRPVSAESWTKLADGGLKFEGFATARTADRDVAVTRLFAATFAPDGQLLGLQSRSLPTGRGARS